MSNSVAQDSKNSYR